MRRCWRLQLAAVLSSHYTGHQVAPYVGRGTVRGISAVSRRLCILCKFCFKFCINLTRRGSAGTIGRPHTCADEPPPLVNPLTRTSEFILISLLAAVLAFCLTFCAGMRSVQSPDSNNEKGGGGHEINIKAKI